MEDHHEHEHQHPRPPARPPPDAADLALKQRHRAMWASGHYDKVAREVIPELGQRARRRARGRTPASACIDIAAGTGNAAVPAARAGARVVASDLTPELLEAGRGRSTRECRHRLAGGRRRGAAVRPTRRTTSCWHASASCSPRTTRRRPTSCCAWCARAGAIGVLSWTPEGFIGRLFATMRDFVPPPPAGCSRRRCGAARSTSASCCRRPGRGPRVPPRPHRGRPLHRRRPSFRDYFRDNYGPTLMAYRGLADQPDRIAALDAALDALAADADEGSGRMRWEYVVVSGRRS